MKVLVTGVAGFIGSNLAEKLLELDYEVMGLDNFDPFYSRNIKERNIESFKHHPNFHFYECDIRTEDLSVAISNQDVDMIIHLAARAGVRPSLRFPESYVHHDIGGTVNILQIMQRFGLKNFIFGSSSSVYGDLPDLPYSEDLNLNQPISPYAAAKLSCELYNYVFHSQYDINVTNLRFFTVYGPRQRPEMGIHKFVRLIDQGKRITMYGDGTSSRDYTYISDIVDGIIKSVEKIGGYHTYNLGNRDAVRLKELIQIVGEVLGKEPEVIQTEMQPGDVTHTLADISKAQSELGYNPKTSIREGVKKFYQWYKKENSSHMKK